jgi:hypothetical protein
MATINSVNNTLTSSSGTTSFAGSDSPTLTGAVDCSGTSFEIPNSGTPTISSAGHIALDTSVTSFKPTIVYHNGTASQALIAVKAANLSTTDGHVIAYDSANTEFKMQAPSGGTGKAIVQYGFANLSSTAATTSASVTATGLTIDITPTVGTNKICCNIFGKTSSVWLSGVISPRYGTVYIRRTVSAVTTTLTTTNVGRVLTSADTSLNTYAPFNLYFEEVPGSTTTRTYLLSFSSPNSGLTFSVLSGTFIYVHELEV